MQQPRHHDLLLSGDDATPVDWMNKDSSVPLLLLCEHAGAEIPASLGDLGLSATAVEAHRKTDIGAEPLARQIAEKLNAPLILQRYSRLVIDCNRPAGSRESVPQRVDGIAIPGNQSGQNQNRIDEIFAPFDDAIRDHLERRQPRAAISIHSFTPRLAGGPERPWHCGFLSRRDLTTAGQLRDAVAARAPDLTLALNEPYQIDSETDWFIPAYGEPLGLAHTLIEVRNELLRTSDDITHWADLLSHAITTLPELTP